MVITLHYYKSKLQLNESGFVTFDSSTDTDRDVTRRAHSYRDIQNIIIAFRLPRVRVSYSLGTSVRFQKVKKKYKIKTYRCENFATFLFFSNCSFYIFISFPFFPLTSSKIFLSICISIVCRIYNEMKLFYGFSKTISFEFQKKKKTKVCSSNTSNVSFEKKCDIMAILRAY